MNKDNTENNNNGESPFTTQDLGKNPVQDNTSVSINNQATTQNFMDAEPAKSQEKIISNAPQNAGKETGNNQQSSAQDIKIEFIKSDRTKPYSFDNPQPRTPARVEDINQMRVQYIEEQSRKQTADDIQLNTELDLELLKDKLNQSGNNQPAGSNPIKDNFYRGKRVLIDAGPTYEKIDDVRFIGNHSTGKMGFAIAEEAAKQGAEVVLVAGPVNLECSKNIYRVNVTSAEEMHTQVMKYLPDAAVIILAAAVADFTPANKIAGKMKKEATGDKIVLELIKTKDILSDAGKAKNKEQKLIGFALEAENLTENAKIKLKNKNCDMIVANKANQKDSGFGGDNNTIILIKKDESIKEFPPMTKQTCAIEILKEITVL